MVYFPLREIASYSRVVLDLFHQLVNYKRPMHHTVQLLHTSQHHGSINLSDAFLTQAEHSDRCQVSSIWEAMAGGLGV